MWPFGSCRREVAPPRPLHHTALEGDIRAAAAALADAGAAELTLCVVCAGAWGNLTIMEPAELAVQAAGLLAGLLEWCPAGAGPRAAATPSGAARLAAGGVGVA
jgi:hypothetical protein